MRGVHAYELMALAAGLCNGLSLGSPGYAPKPTRHRTRKSTGYGLTNEQRTWNESVEAKRLAKKVPA